MFGASFQKPTLTTSGPVAQFNDPYKVGTVEERDVRTNQEEHAEFEDHRACVLQQLAVCLLALASVHLGVRRRQEQALCFAEGVIHETAGVSYGQRRAAQANVATLLGEASDLCALRWLQRWEGVAGGCGALRAAS